ncbi:MAG: hypothetical protein COV67_13780 [Nitrospinae bacterium CG11_big_fil_rev_8_21_14_0_20_56_8]|nr:MAG: hypothetical protein COV67_13780 [Nitrospinae bacterium CG11_big_fil_rev_8_21_14_0_20_56_8]
MLEKKKEPPVFKKIGAAGVAGTSSPCFKAIDRFCRKIPDSNSHANALGTSLPGLGKIFHCRGYSPGGRSVNIPRVQYPR